MTGHSRFPAILRKEREQRNWSQAELAEKAQCDTKTVGRWESGESVPHHYHRRNLCELFGKSPAELGLAPAPSSETGSTDPARSSTQGSDRQPALESVRADWGEAPYLAEMYGRERECAELAGWIRERDCQVGVLIGAGGVGKTAIAASVARHVQKSFECIFWRSLQNAPPLEHFLQQCISFVSNQQRLNLPEKTDDQILLLIEYLRSCSGLLVLDNFESLLEAGQNAGTYRQSYAAYGQLLQLLGEAQHQSFVLLTSREKPREIVHLEGKKRSVRVLALSGLEREAGRQLLKERELSGTDEDWQALISNYSGNPLALQLVSESIQEIFEGNIARFLQHGTITFGDIDELIEQQFRRLSSEEQEMMYWLAIEREAVALDELSGNLVYPSPPGTQLAVLASLLRRSLIEKRGPSLFSLQPVILEYVTTSLVRRATGEFVDELPDVWLRYTFCKAQARGYVRASQERLLLWPIAQGLLARLGKEGIEQHARDLLARQRRSTVQQPDYLAGNLLNLLHSLHCDLRLFDFSQVVIREACLQGITLAGVNFTGAHFIAPIFTSTFGNVLSVACHPQGQALAAGTTSGDIWIYDARTYALLLICRGHTDGVWSLAFSSDGARLASSSDDHTVRLWDSMTGQRLGTLIGHTARTRAVAFSPDGEVLASGSDDQTIRLWNPHSGECLKTLHGHSDRVWSIAFSRDGQWLASGSTDETVCLWDAHTYRRLLTMRGHTDWIRSVAFHPQGTFLASAGNDQTIRVWETATGKCVHTLQGHTNRIWTVTFSPRGDVLASGSEDQTIRLWNSATGQSKLLLTGHTQGVRSLAFAPDGSTLLSGGDDQTVRVWETTTGHFLQSIQGYTNRVLSLAFSSDGQTLASSGEDFAIRFWDTSTGQCRQTWQDRSYGTLVIAFSPTEARLASGGQDQTLRLWYLAATDHVTTLHGHTDWVRAVAFSPDGRMLASGSEDRHVRLWDVASGSCLATLEGHASWVRTVAFSPDGTLLASGADDYLIHIWNVATRSLRQTLQGHSDRVRSIVFSPDRQTLFSGSEDQTIRLWNVQTGQNILTLEGHSGWIRSLALAPDGTWLASGSEDQTIRLWDTRTGQCLATLSGHNIRVRWVACHPSGRLLASGGDDGLVKLWDLTTHACIKTLRSERPYEHMKIARVRGLSEAQKANLRALGASEEEEA